MRFLLVAVLSLLASGCFLLQDPNAKVTSTLVFTQADTLSLVRYEEGGLSSEGRILRLYEDGTYKVFPKGLDGHYNTLMAGEWHLQGERLCLRPEALVEFNCDARVLRNWLHDAEFGTGARSWKESPLNESWPPRS